MRIGVDLDGVVYPFENALQHYLVEHTGFDVARCVEINSWGFYQEWGLTREEFHEACDAAVDAGIMFGWGEPYAGTRDALQQLVDVGHTLHVVTARGGMGTPGRAQGLTQFWLTNYLPPIESLTFSNDKTIVRTDVFIEDKLSNYDALHYSGVRTTLINRPWNQQPGIAPWRRRVDSMEEFAADILGLHGAPSWA